MTAKAEQHTPGAIRAAKAINAQLAAANVKIADSRLADIVDRETNCAELLAALIELEGIILRAQAGQLVNLSSPAVDKLLDKARAAILSATA